MDTITKQRDSNMELLRIITMFLVLLFHVDFISLNGTNHIAPDFTPLKSFIRIFLAISTFTCVDIFVMLSGWYGIKFKYSKLGELVFQVLFFSIISYVIFAFFGIINYKLLLHIFFLDAYWFVPTYLVLYISSPILNSFINNCSKKQLQNTILLLFVAQCCYGWLSPQERGYNEGCSPISFIILYLTARYCKLYPSSLTTLSKRNDLLIFFTACLFASIFVFYGEKYQIDMLTNTMFKFTSPFTIIASLYLILFFSKIKLQKKWINWIAISSFAAFLVHCFPAFNQYIYHNVISYLYLHFSTVEFVVLVLLFIIFLYIASILLDKIRISIYNKISNHFIC